MPLKRKVEVEEKNLEFKKDTLNGYEVITTIGNRFVETIQVGFNDGGVRIANIGTYLTEKDGVWNADVEVKKAFQQTFFEKRGAGYSSVSGGYVGIPIVVPLTVKFNNYGKQRIIKQPVKTWSLEEVWFDGLEFLPENEVFANETKEIISHISNIQIQNLMTAHVSDNLARALFFIVSANQSKFVSEYKTIYVDVPTETWEEADIDVTVGNDEFHFVEYGRLCKNEFGILIFFDFKDELLEELKRLGYKKRW